MPAGTTKVGDVVVVSSPAAAGQFGCQLWVNGGLPYLVSGERRLTLSQAHCHVLVAEPRLLVVRVAAHAFDVTFVGGHAPPCGSAQGSHPGRAPRLAGGAAGPRLPRG